MKATDDHRQLLNQSEQMAQEKDSEDEAGDA